MSARRRSLVPLTVLTLVAVPILEVWLLIQVGRQLGVWWTIAILVAEAVLGGWLLRHEGRRAWSALQEAFGTGRMPTRELSDAALVLVGGVLLMLPGFATDLIGMCCLLPFTRPLARRLLEWLVGRRMSQLTGPMLPAFDPARRSSRHNDAATGVVIEGEVIPAAATDDDPGAEAGGTRRSRLPQRR